MAAPTEVSRFWTTGGAGDGASTYTRDQLAEAYRAFFLSDPTLQGVFQGLAVSGAASPLTLAIGSACVYGYIYFCTVAGDVPAITTPVVNTTGFRVVLRAGWTAQTVRVAVVKNTDGVAAIPAVTQTAGTTWEITLATGTITTGGVITLTDARAFCAAGPSGAALSVLGRSANSIGALAAIVAASDGEVLRRSGTAVGFGTITAAGIADRTRTFLVAPRAAYNDTAGSAITDIADRRGQVLPDAAVSYVVGEFQVPSDYVSGLSVQAIVDGQNSGNIYGWGYYQASANGEDPATHAASQSPAATALTGNRKTFLTAQALTLAAAGDTVQLEWTREGNDPLDTIGGNVRMGGWLVSYTADS